jgi:murein DD-endopeptidase MepM/ murein hydrolase activator NlpD
MSPRGSGPSRVVAAASGGFLAGAIAVALVIWGFPNIGRPLASPLTVANQPLPLSTTAPINATSSLAELRDRHLEIPVRGAVRQKLVDSFDATRDGNRKHEAIDIMAPRNTPILAVEEGTIARLFSSKLGGTTVYQFDPATRYVYYYAHLERYADGLREGDRVQRGEVLGYVGTSGNAPKNTPHLHFAIFLLTEKKQWWRGTPINPYEVLK